jgi:hypothetical protein
MARTDDIYCSFTYHSFPLSSVCPAVALSAGTVQCGGRLDYDYEEREKWVVVRDTTGGGNNLSVLKVPRHCPFVLLVSVSF